jgi:hypothetical protein
MPVSYMWMLQCPNVSSPDTTLYHLAFYTRGERRKFVRRIPPLIQRNSTLLLSYNNYVADRHHPSHPIYTTATQQDSIIAEYNDYVARWYSRYHDAQLFLADAGIAISSLRFKRPHITAGPTHA